MADAKATFEIDLQDGTSGPAKSAASELKKLKEQIGADTRALAEMQRAMKNLQAGSSVNIQQFRALKAQIDAKKQSLAQAQAGYLALGGTFGKTASSGRSVSSLFDLLTAKSEAMGGPLGDSVSKLGSLKSMLSGGVIAVGLVAVAAGMAAITVAAIAATVALAKYGIAQADARRSETLHLEGLTKLRFWYGAAAGNAGELQGAIDRVSSGVSIGRDQVAKYTEQLYRMGLRGRNLEDALEGVAIKAATQGDAAAGAFAGWAAGAALAGGSVRKLTDDVKARLGGIATKQLLSLTVQSQKARESFDALFRDLKIEGLLKAVKMVTDLFSQSTVSGRALKGIFERMLQPMIDGIERAAPLAKRFFQGLIIGALYVEIALLRLRIWWRKTFGDSELMRGIDLQTVAVWAGVAAIGALAASVAVLAVGMGVLFAPVIGVVYALRVLYTAAKDAYQYWAGLDWAGIGTAIVDGLVGGIKSSAKWVVDAMSDLGNAALKSFKKALQIESPSKAFARVGLEIPRGVGVGVAAGKPAVDRAVGDMVDAPAVPSSAPPSVAPAPRADSAPSAAVTVTFGDIIVQTAGTAGREIAQDIERAVEALMERVAVQLAARGA